MTTLEKISPNIGLNAETITAKRWYFWTMLQCYTKKRASPRWKTLSKLSNLSNDPQALEPQDLAARQLDTTLSNDCLMVSNLSSKTHNMTKTLKI